MNKILQWNCQGYKSKYEDFRLLLNRHYPCVALLQETMLNANTPRPPSGYCIYSDFANPSPGHGLVTLIRRDTPHMKIPIQTTLQATAFRVCLSKQYTVCNIYISPNEIVHLHDISSLIDQLPGPVIVCGDFNSRHQLWDSQCTQQDARSNTIESMLLTSTMTILNTGNPTHFHIQTGTSSAIDISMCSADSLHDFSWLTLDDLHGSDHYPIILEELERENHVIEQRYLEYRADWARFERQTLIEDYEAVVEMHSTDELVNLYNSLIIEAADVAIPKTSGRVFPKKVPWWSNKCAEAIIQRKRALRKYQSSLLIVDKIAYCRARAIAKKVQREAKQESWRKYIGSLNVDTPMSKIWRRIRKIRGYYQNNKAPYLIKNDTHITDQLEIAELMASHYEKISSNESYSNKFQRIRRLGALSDI